MEAEVKKNGLRVKRRQSQLKGIWRRLKKNKAAMLGLIVIILLIMCSVFAPFIAPYGYDDQLLSRRFIFPCKAFPFGTDNLGRDILSRVIYGSRISLAVGLVSVSISVVFGTVLGSVAGYYGNVTDNIIMRAIDIVLSIPSILLAISIAAMLGQGLFNLMIAIGVSEIPRYARVVRAQILSVKDQEFVEAARAVGASDGTILFQYILPNALAPILVQVSLGIGDSILAVAGLSYLGLGVQPPQPEWGAILTTARTYMRDAWHISVFPGLFLILAVIAFNLFGDGLRDALDPKLKR